MTRASQQIYKEGVFDAIGTDYGDLSIDDNTMLSSIAEVGGLVAEKTITINPGDAVAHEDALFTVSDVVRIHSIIAYCTSKTDSTTLTGVKLQLSDDTASVDLTTAVDASGIVVGGVLARIGGVTDALVFTNADAAGVQDLDGGFAASSLLVVPKPGVTNSIEIVYTGDADTDLELEFKVIYKPLRTNGITAA